MPVTPPPTSGLSTPRLDPSQPVLINYALIGDGVSTDFMLDLSSAIKAAYPVKSLWGLAVYLQNVGGAIACNAFERIDEGVFVIRFASPIPATAPGTAITVALI